jgi:hypothetical protein
MIKYYIYIHHVTDVTIYINLTSNHFVFVRTGTVWWPLGDIGFYSCYSFTIKQSLVVHEFLSHKNTYFICVTYANSLPCLDQNNIIQGLQVLYSIMRIHFLIEI